MARENDSQRAPQGGECDECGGAASPPQGDTLRCACGSLLARHVEGGIELKCRRCKRTVIVLAASAREDDDTAG